MTVQKIYIWVCLIAAWANGSQAAFIVEVHETGLGFDNFELGGDTFSVSTSIPSTAVGLEGTNSIFGGDGVEFPDTYVFHYSPSEDPDNYLPSAGTVLGSKDGSPGEGNIASGLEGGISGKYNVYATSPASVNVNGVPSLVTITRNGDDVLIDLDENNEMTGPNTQVNLGRGFVGGMNNAWYLLETVELLADESYQVMMEAGSNTFVSQRIHAIMWERVSGSGLLGDFNEDQELDSLDIDALTMAIANASLDSTFDLNEDGDVDLADRDVWVAELRKTWFGDTNMDGEFNSSDFVAVFRSGEYEDELFENSTWRTGDWNGDLEFDSGDFVKAFQDGGFELGPRMVVSSVPEPRSWFTIFIALLGILRWRRDGSRINE